MSKSPSIPFEYYSQHLEDYSRQLSKLARDFSFTAPARLLTFMGLIISALWFIKSSLDYSFLWLSFFFLVLFFLAVIWDQRLTRKQKILKARRKINEDELKYLNHQFSEFDDGSDLAKMAPELSGDLDLFGHGSLFQYLNRCVTSQGRAMLGHDLVHENQNTDIIKKKQESIEELSKNPGFIEEFRTRGLLANIELDEIRKLKEWLNSPSINTSTLKWTGRIWPFLMAGWIAATLLGFISPDFLFVPIIIPFILISGKNKMTQKAHNLLGHSANTLKKHTNLIKLIENQQFHSEVLLSLQQRLSAKKQPASRVLKKLFTLLERFDYRLNLIAASLFNILFLFDYHMLVALEKWKSSHKEDVAGWFEVIAQLDSMTGYAVFAFNNQGTTTFPKLQNGDFAYDAEELKHPLLPDKECVGNDITFAGQPKLLVITGANMAGKSTFLRTLAVNLILGMNGAPVCAKQFRFKPCYIKSSINIHDSLAKHESYFYAELQRLKSIVEHVNQHPNTLVIIDEILRGTNSLDKHNGSVGLLKKLISMKALVAIATHDLGIGDMEQEYPETVTNYCFEVELEKDQLIFDYKLKPGVSQKLNATFLMQKMGLIS